MKKYIYRVNNECIWRIVDNEAIIITKDGRSMHRLNEVGCEIWEKSDGSCTIRLFQDNFKTTRFGQFQGQN